MENEVLRIKYNNGRGRMEINMGAFFPCGKAAFKKLLKVIDMDYENSEKHLEYLKNYFQNQIVLCQNMYESNGKEYFKYKQMEADKKSMAEEKKHPNGIPLTKDELKTARENAALYKLTAAEKLRAANNYKKRKNKFEMLLTLL